ncbi:MAG: hypothetical protein ACE5ER_08670, partial [Nitrospinaceae bacterium]
MKRWLLIGGVVLVLVATTLFFIFSSLDEIITRAVEHYGSEITQTEVRLAETKISAASGQGILKGMSIANPGGFKTPHAFEFAKVSLTLDIATLTEPVIVIKEIVIASPAITYELGSQGNNIDALKKNVEASLHSKPADPAAGQAPATAAAGKNGSGGEKKFIIERLSIQDGKVLVSATALNGRALTINLPTVRLNNLGAKKGGLSAGEMVNTLVTTLNRNIGQAVGGLDLGQAKKAALPIPIKLGLLG